MSIQNHVISNVLGNIRSSYQRRINVTSHVKSKELLGLLNKLASNGFIYGYIIIGNLVKIQLKYNRNSEILKNYKVYSSPGRKFFLSVYKLKSLVYLYPTTWFLLNTDKGLKTHQEAIDLNIGGELLFSIQT